MPSILAHTQSQASNTFTSQHPTKKFRTVLGLSAISQLSSPPSSPTSITSFDSSHSNKRKIRQGSSGVTQTSFYDPIHPSQDLDTIVIEEMAIDLGLDPVKIAHPRGLPTPVRMDTQDGPWAISTAENDPHTYSIYVKSTYLVPLNFSCCHGLNLEICFSPDPQQDTHAESIRDWCAAHQGESGTPFSVVFILSVICSSCMSYTPPSNSHPSLLTSSRRVRKNAGARSFIPSVVWHHLALPPPPLSRRAPRQSARAQIRLQKPQPALSHPSRPISQRYRTIS
jgi:hypothetical protein